MSFMQKEITNETEWYEIDTGSGTYYVQVELVGKFDLDSDEETQLVKSKLVDYCEGDILYIEIITGYGARLSANGYLDATEWAVYDTIEDAEQALNDLETLELEDNYGNWDE